MRKYTVENAETGNRIRSIRQAADLTQEQFSERIGVTGAYISEVERGVVGISSSTVKRISQCFHVSCDWILCGRNRADNISRLTDKLQHIPESQIPLLEKVIDLFLLAISQQQ